MIRLSVLDTSSNCAGFRQTFLLGWLVLSLAQTVSLYPTSESKLLLVFALSRHGDRSPANVLIGDPYAEHWSAGYGQLTELGATQHVELGQFIRDRYAQFIPQKYHKDECIFRSSGMHRTLQSASSFLVGLYQTQPQGESYLVPPVFYTPNSDDHLLKMSHNCPRYIQHLHELSRSQAVVDKVHSFASTVDTFKQEFPQMYSVFNSTALDILSPTAKICDHVLIWVAHNLTLRPAWVSDRLVRDCRALLDYKMSLHYSTPLVRRFRGGPLAAHLMRLFRDRANVELGTKNTAFNLMPQPLGPDLLLDHETEHEVRFLSPHYHQHNRGRRRLIAYFAHDSTLAALMSHLGVFDGHQPPLASCFFVELHHLPSSESPKQEQFFLRFFYRNSSLPDPRPPLIVWPPACGPIEMGKQLDFLCPLTRLESALWGTYVLQDRSDECDSVSTGLTFLGSIDLYYIPLFVIILCQFFLMLYFAVRLNLRSFRSYDRLPV